MKIIISYPPLYNGKGHATLGQNRQFQYFKEPTYIYPVVPATAATLLKDAGHEVIWNDCIAEGLDYKQFIGLIQREKPDLIVFETKTPVIKQHWKIINELKKLIAESCKLKIVLFGDHVTALPEESFQNSQVDFVLTGGDYDFLLLNLCNFLTDGSANPRTTLEPGIYYRDDGSIINTGAFMLGHDLNSVPFIDRDLTKWLNYAYKNGNYKSTPGTYIMSGRDCWYHDCTFCSWPVLYPKFRSRKPANVLEEIDILREKYKVREVMDDTGCFPVGDWLREFCHGMIKRGVAKGKFYLDCNMRFGALTFDDFLLMKKANFRLLLFGLESANQVTLDKINKKLKAEQIIEDCKLATKAGLFPHITIMFGYPWESYQDALKTLKLGTWLLKKGYAYTMQATLVIPYPGTPLFKDCQEQHLIRTLNWDCYDMKQPVLSSPIPDCQLLRLVQEMYEISFSPEFILRKIFSLRDLDDMKYFLRAAKKVTGHVLDFKRHPALK